MVFSSLVFLCIFLPVVLVVYNLSKSITFKNIVLLVASLVFYAWGEPKWIVVMIITSFVDFVAGKLIDKYKGTKKAKLFLALSIILTLGALIVFKYMNFLTHNLNLLPFVNVKETSIALPIGISFYTFQVMSYVVDVYTGKVEVQKKYYKLLLYVSMFPQLIAGPIVRYSTISEEIENRKVSLEQFSDGITRFVAGLAKKVILANYLGLLVDSTIGGEMKSLSCLGAWTGLIAYFFQIYFDFSGYSDMAIGMGKMLGFNFLENFDYPYTARSITSFWRKWHISLSSFFRDYVYIPLGGNRRFQLRNMFVVWVLTGFWHGASWNFIIWGFYYFVLLAAEKYIFKNK
ncbi:MAG: MBOAT family protein, partial [Clostridia bacterium]|nr:MBOAT family protein [Clostridia bacterium]